MKLELQNDIFLVLRKYGLIFIGYTIWSKFAAEFLETIFKSLELFNNGGSPDIDSPASGFIGIIARLIVWLLMLSDIGQHSQLKWLLLFVTLFNPGIGVTFVVIYIVAGLRKNLI
jgi:hypothetical protein